MMKCNRCGKEHASVHIIELRGGEISDLHLCAGCAREAGYITGPEAFTYEEIINRMITDNAEVSPAALDPNPPRCSVCGNPFEKWSRGVFGCENEFSEFRAEISKLMSDLTGVSKHRGRGKVPTSEQTRTQQMIAVLQRQLEQAVKAEDYEAAALLRDKIKGLK
ncbi:MAG: hypothetical protein Kow00107_10750 [Planctomycetota bacterium]